MDEPMTATMVNESFALVTRRHDEMIANRAALPKPPAYAREFGTMRNELERRAGMKRREPYKAPIAPPPEETISFLFAQLREMGVSCVSCKSFSTEYRRDKAGDGACHEIDRMNGGYLEEGASVPPDFLCNEWDGR